MTSAQRGDASTRDLAHVFRLKQGEVLPKGLLRALTIPTRVYRVRSLELWSRTQEKMIRAPS